MTPNVYDQCPANLEATEALHGAGGSIARISSNIQLDAIKKGKILPKDLTIGSGLPKLYPKGGEFRSPKPETANMKKPLFDSDPAAIGYTDDGENLFLCIYGGYDEIGRKAGASDEKWLIDQDKLEEPGYLIGLIKEINNKTGCTAITTALQDIVNQLDKNFKL